MIKYTFSDLININALRKMSENLYAATGIPIGIKDPDGNILLRIGWQDICTKHHRMNEATNKRCMDSNNYLREHIRDGGYAAYKCLNNLWDIAVPIIISGEHIATVVLGQFFYEDEEVDVEYFRLQAKQFGFEEKEYIEALERVPVYSKQKVEYIMEYYCGLVMTLSESGLRQLEYESSQRELESNRLYIDTILNSVNEAILVNDIDGNIIDVNRTATDMFGYTYEELTNMNIKDIISKNSPYTTEKVFELINSNPHPFELILKNKICMEFWVEANVSITKLGDKNRIIATVRNISERKKAEMAMRNEAHELEKLRTEFFANISHELRTPLNIILGTIQIDQLTMGDETKPINRKKILKNINIARQNCFRLQRLINNLIDSTKLDSSNFELNMINCNIVNVVEEITLSVAEYINGSGLNLVFDTDVEERIIACDPDKIERIMLNLLSNSVKFTNSGGKILVNVFNGENLITITIKDTGVGIPEDKLGIIFDRFRQVDKSFTRSHEGSGVGLSLVKSLVEMHGGTIEVNSVYGLGTKFTIKIPVKVFSSENVERNKKIINNTIKNNVERINIEFSDIYK